MFPTAEVRFLTFLLAFPRRRLEATVSSIRRSRPRD
jgi:hypothetical protein